MKKNAKRFLAILMTAVMLATVFPTYVFASLTDNDPAYNREILETLKEIAGSEDEAQKYYTALQEYGFLDEDGNLIESWTIEYHGKEITPDELREIVAGEIEPNDIIWIDDTPYPLDEVAVMVKIEDYVQHVKETYFSEKEWTDEQIESYQGLMKQINTKGLSVDPKASAVVGPSGVNHAARISVERTGDDTDDRTVTYTATLYGGTAGQTVSFDWQAFSGSRPVSGASNGTVSITADRNGTGRGSFTVGYAEISCDSAAAPVRTPSSNTTVFYVSCLHPQNALFSNGKESVYFRVDTAGTVEDKFPDSGAISNTLDWMAFIGGEPYTYDIWGEFLTALRWGIINHVKTSIDGEQFKTPFTAVIGSYNSSNGDFAQRDASGNIVQWTDDDLAYVQYRSTSFKYWSTKEYDLTDYPTKKSRRTPLAIYPYNITDTNNQTHSAYMTYEFSDVKAPEVLSYVVPPRDTPYCSGEVIPIVVTFSEPVQAHPTLKVNGVTIHAVESGICNVMTFPYEVLEPDRNDGKFVISDIRAVDIVGNVAEGRLNADGHTISQYGEAVTVNNVTIDPLNKAHTFSTVTAEIDNTDLKNPRMKVKVGVSDNEQLTQWMGSDFTRDPDGSFTSKSIKATVDGENFIYLKCASEQVTGGELFADIPLPVNTGASAVSYTAELYMDDQLLFGRAAQAALPPVTLVSGDDIEAYVSVKQIDGVTDYQSGDGTIWLQDYPRVRAYYKLKGDNFTYRDVVWKSLDTNIANIDQDGRITPTGIPGKVRFRAIALNGGFSEEGVYADTEELTFGSGLTPFLTIFTSVINTVSGEPATVCWCSNICNKNGAAETTFSVNVKRGGLEVYSGTVKGNADDPAASVSIPGDVLRYNYGPEAVNVFDVTVSTTYGGRTYSAAASVRLRARPATVRLKPLENYSIVDTEGTFTIDWEITDFDRYSADTPEKLFKLQIKKGKEILTTVYDPMGDTGLESEEEGVFNGSYTLGDIAVHATTQDKNSYRDIYTITIEVKNGADSTWSRDSYILYVYDGEALKLWINGEAPKNGKYTLTNIPAISAMTQDERLALRRDISLRAVVSANYGDYAWSELGDQLSWSSSDNNVATINYKQGAVEEDIRNVPYVSYRPTTDFTISGLSNGKTVIDAKHVYTGMTADVEVNVETLENKLYLFQCYPQIKTTLTYQTKEDDKLIKKTVTSDENGAFAIYAENGITGDVYCRSDIRDELTQKTTTYLGTFSSKLFETGERDSTRLDLYPCTHLTLKPASYAYLYIKQPDGKPYTGKITLRGGVYVNENLVDSARFAYNDDAADQPGNIDKTVDLDSDGKLEILTDPTQWGLPDGQIGADTKIGYTFLIKQGQGKADYYPLFANIDAKVSAAELSSRGEVTVTFRKNDSKEIRPFIMGQTVSMEDGLPESVLKYTGAIGVSDDWKSCVLTTIVLWWGATDGKDNKSLVLHTDSDKPRTADDVDEKSQTTDDYKFIDECVTTYQVTIDDEHTDLVKRREIKTPYLSYLSDGKQIQQEKMPFRVCNVIGAGRVEESDSLLGSLQQLGSAFSGSSHADISGGDNAVKGLLKFCEGSFCPYSAGTLQLVMTPTSDPTKFLGFASVNHNTIMGIQASGDVNTSHSEGSGAAALSLPVVTDLFKINGRDMSGHMARVDKFNQSKDTRDLVDMTINASDRGKSWESYKEQYLKKASNTSSIGGWSIGGKFGPGNPSGAIGGYCEFLVYYDFESKQWRARALDGGFNVSLGYGYEEAFYDFIGPFPITSGYAYGANIDVNLDVITTAYLPKSAYDAGERYKTELDNEYLWQLKVGAFLKLFAGLGISGQDLLTLRIVAFAKVSFTFTFDWLKRPYLSRDKEKNKNAYVLADGALNTEAANLDGQDYRLALQIGLEFTIKVLFFKYNKILAQTNFSIAGESGKWKRLNKLWKENQANLHWTIEEMLKSGSARLEDVGGVKMLSVDFAPTIENRDYLTTGGRRGWGEKKLFGIFKAPATTDGLTDLERNTYPYADPEVTRDGSLLVYLSDMESSDVADTRAMFSLKGESGSYAPGQPIDDAGCGDMHLSVDGTSSFAVAAWTRQTVDLKKDAGAVVADEDQMIMLENTDVYASVWNGSEWDTVCLDNEGGAGIAPTVAAANGKAVVAWRSVSVGDTSNITDFDKEDAIEYKVYADGAWSETRSLYNGTSGSVQSVVSAMMPNGAAAVAVSLDSGDRSDIFYTVIGADGEVLTSVRPTANCDNASNPQLAAVTMKVDGADQERFVLSWYSELAAADDDDVSGNETGTDPEAETSEDDDADTVDDICLIDFDDSGMTDGLLPQSLRQMAGETRVPISPNFRFTKTEGSINDLSIVWSQHADEQPEDFTIEKDVLKSVRFFSYGENADQYDISCDMDVGEMPDNTTINHFAAYSSGNTVSAILHASTAIEGSAENRTEIAANGEAVSYPMPKTTDAMYTATDTYEDKIEVPVAVADYESIKLGADTQIQMDVENRGVHPVTSISVDIGGIVTTVEDIFLLPGDTQRISADYTVPEDRVTDPEFTVTAEIDTGKNTVQKTASGTVYLGRPDIEITDAAIMREEDGERDIRVTLNNRQDARLEDSRCKVRVSFWSDPTYENRIETVDPIIVKDPGDLKMIDEGGYCCQIAFDVASYIRGDSEDPVEIPASGVPVYIKAEVLDKDGNPVAEPVSADNTQAVTCENLSIRADERQTIETRYSAEENEATVDLQNLTMTPVKHGNVVVTLFDENGEVIEQKQTYTGKSRSLIQLDKEEKTSVTVSFDAQGAAATAQFIELNDDADNAELSALHFAELPGISLESFRKQSDGTYKAEIENKDLNKITVAASAQSIRSAIEVRINGSEQAADAAMLAETFDLIAGENNTAEIIVTAENGKAQTYILQIRADGSSGDDPSVVCPWCGKTHTGFLGGLIRFFHRLLYFFAHLFGRR